VAKLLDVLRAVRRLCNRNQPILMCRHLLGEDPEALECHRRACFDGPLQRSRYLPDNALYEGSAGLRSGERGRLPYQLLNRLIVPSQFTILNSDGKRGRIASGQEFLEETAAFQQNRRLVSQVLESTQFGASRLERPRGGVVYDELCLSTGLQNARQLLETLGDVGVLDRVLARSRIEVLRGVVRPFNAGLAAKNDAADVDSVLRRSRSRVDDGRVDSFYVEASPRSVRRIPGEKGDGTIPCADIEDPRTIGELAEERVPMLPDVIVVIASKCIRTGMQSAGCPIVAPRA